MEIGHCKAIVHFNKAHNADPSIPPWVVKAKGQTYYVNHVTISAGIGFSTRETPEHTSTKAALVLRGDLSIKEEEATFS